MNVLLVEQSITIAKVVELSLGAPVTVVTSIAEAKSAMATTRPDVVIAALKFSDGDGYELCRTIKTVHRIPVILLRGVFEKFDEEKAKAAGADAILSKPFKPDDLLGAIQTAVRH